MTSFGNEGNGLQMIRHVLVQSSLSQEDIAQIAKHLPPAADPWPEEWARLREFEKLQYMNLLGRLYEIADDGTIRYAAYPFTSPQDQKPGRGWPRLYWWMSMPRDPRGVRAIVDKHFAQLERTVNVNPLPAGDRYDLPSRATRKDLAKAVCNPYRWCVEMWFFNEREYLQHRQWRLPAITARRGTWLILGLRRYREAHGVWPQTLAAISEYIPAEAFLDPTTDEAFVYTLDGDGFKLYSKGPNRIDDGGRRGYIKALKKSEDDIWIWPPPAPEPHDDELTDEEMMKELELIYGRGYVETYRKQKGSDKR